jgi:hypothetical protein
MDRSGHLCPHPCNGTHVGTGKMSLLRDHITLITDLAKDWSSGATGDFHHFIPCDYQFRITLTDYSIKLYVNDFNIVDSPNKSEANCKLIDRGTGIDHG